MVAAPLTLRSIQTRAVEVPMARALGTSAQTMNSAPILLIDMQTEEGIVGRAYLFCYTRMAPGLIAAVLTDIADALHGERIAPVDFSSRLPQRYRLLGAQGIVRMALAGFDVACWDALSLAAGLPLASYIGSQPRPILAYNSTASALCLRNRRPTKPRRSWSRDSARSSCASGAQRLNRTWPWCEQCGTDCPTASR
jgi:mandelate racemase